MKGDSCKCGAAPGRVVGVEKSTPVQREKARCGHFAPQGTKKTSVTCLSKVIRAESAPRVGGSQAEKTKSPRFGWRNIAITLTTGVNRQITTVKSLKRLVRRSPCLLEEFENRLLGPTKLKGFSTPS